VKTALLIAGCCFLAGNLGMKFTFTVHRLIAVSQNYKEN